MKKVRSYRDLLIWQRGIVLAKEVYEITRTFPSYERYGLSNQLQRAVVSVPSNIAEGCGRTGSKELRRFLEIAAGSASELEYHLLLARDLHVLDVSVYQQLDKQTCEVKRMLSAFIQKLMAES